MHFPALKIVEFFFKLRQNPKNVLQTSASERRRSHASEKSETRLLQKKIIKMRDE